MLRALLIKLLSRRISVTETAGIEGGSDPLKPSSTIDGSDIGNAWDLWKMARFADMRNIQAYGQG